MSVAALLGLQNADAGVLVVAAARWPEWQRRHPVLRKVDGLVDLPGWLETAGPVDGDEVLLALAELASPRGRDDVVATAVLAWVMLPAAAVVACRLRDFSTRIDELVAAQLWIEARTVRWEGGHKVAANIAMNTRKAVLRDLGRGVNADRTWAGVVTSIEWCLVTGLPSVPFRAVPGGARDAGDELAGVMDEACARGVITASDRELLIDVAQVCDRHQVPTRRGCAGLLSGVASEELAARRGVTARTIRRRTQQAVAALRHLHAHNAAQ